MVGGVTRVFWKGLESGGGVRPRSLKGTNAAQGGGMGERFVR